jgi:hypothetical protein
LFDQKRQIDTVGLRGRDATSGRRVPQSLFGSPELFLS